ncbi:MAG TPA: ABC transporter permease [Gaiellales bacterium]
MSAANPPVEAAGALDAGVGQVRRELLHQLLHSKTFVIGAVIVIFWALCALLGSALAPHDPLGQNLLATNQRPSGAHWFGTDQLGRDVFSRVIAGARSILIVAPLATLIGTVLGTALGLAMGYLSGWTDTVASRIVEAVLALPVVIIAFLFVVALGPSPRTLTIVIGFVFTPLIARTVRSAVLSERELDYIAAARLRGERSPYIMFAEILPNVLQPILVEFTVRVGYAIFAVATLSFLGFGIQPPTADWGADISVNYAEITAGFWWETLFPALAIASLVVAVNLIADSISGVLEG